MDLLLKRDNQARDSWRCIELTRSNDEATLTGYRHHLDREDGVPAEAGDSAIAVCLPAAMRLFQETHSLANSCSMATVSAVFIVSTRLRSRSTLCGS
jgi:hypothetical protein